MSEKKRKSDGGSVDQKIGAASEKQSHNGEPRTARSSANASIFKPMVWDSLMYDDDGSGSAVLNEAMEQMVEKTAAHVRSFRSVAEAQTFLTQDGKGTGPFDKYYDKQMYPIWDRAACRCGDESATDTDVREQAFDVWGDYAQRLVHMAFPQLTRS